MIDIYLDVENNVIRNKLGIIYIRRALVAASFEDEELGVYANKKYILEVIKDILE